MRRALTLTVLAALLVACASETATTDPLAGETSTTSTSETAEPSTTEAPETTTTTEPATTTTTVDWAALITPHVNAPADITEVTVSADVMRITTTLGYAPDDPTRRGMATDVCFAAQAAGWDQHIEVHANNGGILAWTGSNLQGCAGHR